MKQLLIVLLGLTLIACGGSNSPNTPTASTVPSTPGLSCSGSVKSLFEAMQGTYDGLPDPNFNQSAGAPLTLGATYPVTIAAKDCSIRFTGAKGVQYAFAFNDPANTKPSNFIGFTPSKIIPNPDQLDLTTTQYNISIVTANNTIELERRVVANAGGVAVANGDLHLLSLPGPSSFGALNLKAASKH